MIDSCRGSKALNPTNVWETLKITKTGQAYEKVVAIMDLSMKPEVLSPLREDLSFFSSPKIKHFMV